MPSFRDFITGLRKLEIERSWPVIVHASLSAFGMVQGGGDSMLGALLSSFDMLIMPAFTYKTMIIPEIGPLDNAIVYGSGKDANRMAEIYSQDMPADKTMGVVAEALRQHPRAERSSHPILSFTGVNASPILEAQTMNDPLLPIQALNEAGGWVLLLGVDQTSNTSIHFAEQLAGRKQFVRWALTSTGVVTCPGFPGCSQGFEALSPELDGVIRSLTVGDARLQAMPVAGLLDRACAMLKKNPTALLCNRADCERCNTIRAAHIEL